MDSPGLLAARAARALFEISPLRRSPGDLEASVADFIPTVVAFVVAVGRHRCDIHAPATASQDIDFIVFFAVAHLARRRHGLNTLVSTILTSNLFRQATRGWAKATSYFYQAAWPLAGREAIDRLDTGRVSRADRKSVNALFRMKPFVNRAVPSKSKNGAPLPEPRWYHAIRLIRLCGGGRLRRHPGPPRAARLIRARVQQLPAECSQVRS